MVSRKTYFGIGLPKDPTDPQSTVDPADQSQPTVVDDEKVAEGLKQLRSWYQESSQEEDTRRVVPPSAQGAPAPASVQVSAGPAAPQARPTAVGHATNDTPPQTQRPIAPDPMRATMFGHDVHRFDLEAYMAANATPPLGNPTAPAGTTPPLGDPSWRPEPARQPYETRTPYEARHHVDGVPRPVGAGAPSGPSQLADFLRRQAERPNPAALRMSSLDDTDSYEAPRVPMSARIVLVTGLAALTVAVVFWIRSRSNADLNVMPPGSAPAIGADRLPARALDPMQERRVLDTARRTAEPSAPATVPAPPRVPSEAAKPVIPPLPPALVKDLNATRRSSSTEIAPAKTVRRARVGTTPRPSADAPAESAADVRANAGDEKPAGATADQTASPPARIEAPVAPAPVEKTRERRAAEREREKRAVERDNDATLPPSAE